MIWTYNENEWTQTLKKPNITKNKRKEINWKT